VQFHFDEDVSVSVEAEFRHFDGQPVLFRNDLVRDSRPSVVVDSRLAFDRASQRSFEGQLSLSEQIASEANETAMPAADRLGQVHVQGVNLLGGGIAQHERRVIGS
jgi:hypothetical protein